MAYFCVNYPSSYCFLYFPRKYGNLLRYTSFPDIQFLLLCWFIIQHSESYSTVGSITVRSNINFADHFIFFMWIGFLTSLEFCFPLSPIILQYLLFHRLCWFCWLWSTQLFKLFSINSLFCSVLIVIYRSFSTSSRIFAIFINMQQC